MGKIITEWHTKKNQRFLALWHFFLDMEPKLFSHFDRKGHYWLVIGSLKQMKKWLSVCFTALESEAHEAKWCSDSNSVAELEPLPELLNSKWQTFNVMAAIVRVEARQCALIRKDTSRKTKWTDKLTSSRLSLCKMKQALKTDSTLIPQHGSSVLRRNLFDPQRIMQIIQLFFPRSLRSSQQDWSAEPSCLGHETVC